jgi:hypothetical protein
VKPTTVLLLLLALVGTAPAIDSLNFRTIGFYQMGVERYVALDSDYACVTDIDGSLRVISVADPAHLFEVGHYDTTCSYLSPTIVKKGYVYLPDSISGVHVISIADPAHPVEVGFLYRPTAVGRIAVAGQYAYMVDTPELLIVSIADPANPVLVASCTTSATVMGGVAVSGNYAYVIDFYQGLKVISIADPLHPVEIGHCDLTNAYTVAVSGSYVWAGGLDGSSVISVVDPAHPTVVGFHGAAQVTDVTMDGDIVYEAASGWLNAVSIADPANPLDVGYYHAAFTACGVAFAGGYVYSAGANGLLVVQHYESGVEESFSPQITSRKLLPTVIRALPRGSVAFDAMGRRVVSPRSGVYFVREAQAQAQAQAQATRKVVLQR